MPSDFDFNEVLKDNAYPGYSEKKPYSGWLMYKEENERLLLTKYCDNLAVRLGYSKSPENADSLIGFNVLDLVPWYARQEFLSRLNEITLGQEPAVIVHPYVSFDSTVVDIEERVILFSNENNVRLYASVYEDVEYKKLAIIQNNIEQMVSVFRYMFDEVAVMNFTNNTYINVTSPSGILPLGKQTGLISDEVARFQKELWTQEENLVWQNLIHDIRYGSNRRFVPCEPVCIRFYDNKTDNSRCYKIRFIPVESDIFIFLARAINSDEQSALQNGIKNKQWDIASRLPTRISTQKAEPRLVFIRTFGYFDVFVNGKPVAFHSAKAKELLALLTDRRGGYVSSRDAISLLWEDEPVDKTTLARFRKIAMRLNRTLEENGIADIIEIQNNKRRINPMALTCDLFSYLADSKENANLFSGSYMSNYCWGENTLALLEQNRLAEP